MAQFRTLKTLRGPIAKGQVPYSEIAEYKTVIRGNAYEATRVCLVEWSQRAEFIQAMLPLVAVGDTVAAVNVGKFAEGGAAYDVNRLTLNRYDPEPHPKYPWLYAMEAEEMEGIGSLNKDPGSSAIVFRDKPGIAGSNDGAAKIAITYRGLPFNITPAGQTNGTINVHGANPVYELERYVSVKPKPAGKQLPLAGGTFREVDSPTVQIPESGVMPITETHLAYTWHMCPKVPASAATMMGCVNSQYFDAVARDTPYQVYNFFPGTILYVNHEIGDYYYLADGTKVCDLTYHFLYRSWGHNKVFRPLIGQWRSIFRNAANANPAAPPANDFYRRYAPGYNLQDWADLNLLFVLTSALP